MRRALCAWPLALAGCIVLALGLPTILFPLGPDQAIFSYIAHRISLGGFPYVSAWDQKPPAIYLLYIIGIHFPGPVMRNVRLFDLCMLGLTLSAIYLFAHKIWNRTAAFSAALLYGSAYTTEYGYWHMAQPDGYTALPLCLSAWLYYRFLRERRVWPYVAAGFLTGFAFQLRFFSALIGIALVYVEWNFAQAGGVAWGAGLRAAVRRIAWFSGGFVGMQALFAVYLLMGHALGAYLMTEFTFASRYARLGGEYSPNGLTLTAFEYAARENTALIMAAHLAIVIPALIAVALALRLNGDRRVREVALLALTAYVGVLVQAKFFWYHWLAVLPFAALLGGKGLADLSALLLREQRRAVAYLSLAMAVIALVYLSPAMTEGAIQQWRGLRNYYGGEASRRAFNNQFGPYAGGTYSYLADAQVARYINERTRPGDTIYIYGYEALVYLLAERESASRFFYVFPVISTWTPPEWRAEWVRELNARLPRYLLVQANEGAPWITGLHEDTARYAAHDPDLQQLLVAHYDLETTIEDFTIYRRRG
ncbi:MAG TPA: glycosyltransferase family 39 protein [Dehalococcoidia bacterium]|nr:glycosyltransferase family 39 protein [Dehalococcoidia bacterium]